MGILSGYLGLEFFKYCYTPMGEIMDLLTLLVKIKKTHTATCSLNFPCLELHDQLYPLLHNVETVQTDLQVIQQLCFVNTKLCFCFMNSNLNRWKFWRIKFSKQCLEKFSKSEEVADGAAWWKTVARLINLARWKIFILKNIWWWVTNSPLILLLTFTNSLLLHCPAIIKIAILVFSFLKKGVKICKILLFQILRGWQNSIAFWFNL